jgi:hypothetical protein
VKKQLLLPCTALVARETDANNVHARYYAQEKQRLEEREKRHKERQKQAVARSVKRVPPLRRQVSAEAKLLAKPAPPAAVAVVVEERKLEEGRKHDDAAASDIALLERQLAANRRMSVSLQRTIVQKAIIAKKKDEKNNNMSDADLTSTSLDSTTGDDDDDDDDKNTSFATAQLLEEDIPKSLRPTANERGEDDSEIEIFDAHADRRGSFIGKRGSGPPGEKKVSVPALATPEEGTNDTSETKEDILEVFRTWGGREAVEAAEAGDAVKVRRAIERHDAGRIESMNLSPRSRDRALFGKLQNLIKSNTGPRGSVIVRKDSLSEARQRLAVSLQRNQEAERVAQEAEAESRSTKTAQEKTLSMEEEDDAYKNFTMANLKIREILDYKNQVQVTEEDNGVSFVDGLSTPALAAGDDGIGAANVAPEEVEQKMQLINHLLLMLQKEQAKQV